ncbi:MAG: hypothetical protein JNL08_15200 [Planctomycetes bacterium]|nr:hypothetical protein [Planctomycetota bacterium]
MAVLTGSLSVATPAQGCSGSGTFWKRDNLPTVPSGPLAAAVIRGLCEGESAGVVFEMPANMPPQRLKEVVAPWGEATAGTPGFQAQLDVLIYDGVSWSGGIPNMGNLVFQLSSTGQGMPVQTHGFNVLDVSSHDIVVGLAPATGTPPVRRFAVCFRVDLNLHPTGSCATGYLANFFTDTQTQLFGCSGNAQANVMEIQGVGWRNPNTFSLGLPLCPLYYNGNWGIRCCTEDAYPAYYTTIAAGCPSTAGVSHLVPATLPRIGTTMLVVIDHLPYSVALMLMDFTNVPIDVTAFGLTGCTLQTGLTFNYACLGGGGTAVHSLAFPLDNSLLGIVLFQQAFVIDPPLNPFGGALSDAAQMQIGI